MVGDSNSGFDFASLLNKILTLPPYSSWQKTGSGPDGSGAWRDPASGNNPSIQLNRYGLYDFKAERLVKSLIEVARDLGLGIADGIPAAKKRRTGIAAAQKGLDEARERTLNRIREKLGASKEFRQRWIESQWPVIRKYFGEVRGIPESICGAKFFFGLGVTVQEYEHPETKEPICEIVIPMFGAESAGSPLVQVMKIQVDKETGKKKAKKLKGTADQDRAIVFGAVEASEVWIFEGIENALSAYSMALPEERAGRAYVVAGPAVGFSKLGSIIQGYSRRVVVCDPDADRKSLRASAVLGAAVERLEHRAPGSPDLNAGSKLEDYRWVGWEEVRGLVEVEEEREETEAEADSYEYHATWNPFSDQGAAKFFVKRFGDRVRISEDGRWWTWDGKVWSDVHAESTIRQWIASLLPVYLKMSKDQRRGEGERETAQRFAKSLGMANRQSAVMKCLPGHKRLQIGIADFDNKPDILNCQNGIVDLKTGKLGAHNPRALCTKITTVDYIPYNEGSMFEPLDAPGGGLGLWGDFLLSACGANDQWLEFFHRMVGYSITGQTSEKSLFFAYGVPNSGKSTFSEALIAALGSGYATAADIGLFADIPGAGQANSSDYKRARLLGVRLVFTSETSGKQKLSPNIIKDLTGNDTVTARFPAAREFSYKPNYKIWIRGNHAPNLGSVDEALMNRLKILYFSRSFTGEADDKSFREKLTGNPQNLAAVLSWAIRGAVKWYAGGLCEYQSEEISELLSVYKESSPETVVQQFVDDCSELTTDQRSIRASDIHALFMDYRKTKLLPYPGQNTFYKILKNILTAKGCVSLKPDNISCYGGIKFEIQTPNVYEESNHEFSFDTELHRYNKN